ncbi:MarR family transcriptional regulator [Streptosporangium lutulentum]
MATRAPVGERPRPLLQLEPATLSPLLKRLEANGFVNRPRASQDERLSRSPSLPPVDGCATKPRRSPRRSSSAWEWNRPSSSGFTGC